MKKILLFTLGMFLFSGCGQVEKEVKIPHPANIRMHEPTTEELEEAEWIKQSMKDYQERHELQSEKELYESDKLSIEQTLFSKDFEAIPITEKELEQELYYDSFEELAIFVMAEAGNRGLKRMRMAAKDVLNRVKSPDYPDTIHEVLSQMNQDAENLHKIQEPSEECYKAVRIELKNSNFLESSEE